MPEVRKRTVRLHAVRAGDEFYHDHKWWIVREHSVPPGTVFKGVDKDRKPRTETVGNFNPEHTCAIWLMRGSVTTVVMGGRTLLVKIIRRPK